MITYLILMSLFFCSGNFI